MTSQHPSEAQQPTSSTRLPTRPTLQSSNSTTPVPQPPAPIPDSPPSSLPLPLSASLLLTSLPRDATSALAQAVQDIDAVPLKVTIRLHPIGSAPALRQKVFRVSASNRFETVVAFLRKKLRLEAGVGGGDAGSGLDGGGSVFCYVNSVFAPGLDEGVGALWRCFKTDDQLIVGYSITPAFG